MNRLPTFWGVSLLLMLFLRGPGIMAQEQLTPSSGASSETLGSSRFFEQQSSILLILGAVIVVLSLVVCVLLWHLYLHRKMERALLESEERHRLLFDNASVGIGYFTPQGHVIVFNKLAAAYMGGEPGDYAGQTFIDLFGEKAGAVYQERFKTVLESGASQVYESLVSLPRGERWLLSTYSRIMDARGQVAGVQIVSNDITERKRIEAELHTNYERLQMSQAIGHVASWEYDIITNKIWGSEEGFRIYGLTPDETGNLPIEQIEACIPERERVHQALLDLIQEDKPYDLEFAVNPQQDSEKQIIISSIAHLVRNDRSEPVKVVGVIQDITNRKRTEEALNESRRTLSTLLSNLPGMAYRCRNDREWRMLFVSEGAIALTGYAPDDLIENRRIVYGDLIHPDDAERVWTDIQTTLAEDGAFQLTYRIIARDGTEKWVWEQGRGVSLPDGSPVLEGFIADVTARHLAEAAEREQRELAQALSKIALALSRHLDVDVLGGVVLDQVQRVVEYNIAALFRVSDDLIYPLNLRNFPPEMVESMREGVPAPQNTLVFQAIHKRQPIFTTWTPEQTDLPSFSNLPETHSRIAVPLIGQNKVVGLLYLVHQTPGYFNAEMAAKLSAFAHHVTVAIQKAELFQQHRQLTQKLVLAQEEERRRVAHELHDDVGQALTALRMNLQLFRHDLTDEAAKAKMDGIVDFTQTIVEKVRRVSYGLHPPALDTLGLNLALTGLCEGFTEHTELPIIYTGQEVPGLSETAQISLYRIVQESLTNAARHAHATEVTVELSDRGTEVILEINDNGQGFDLAQIMAQVGRTGLGLLGIRERAEILGGRVEIQSEPGQGTHIRVIVPQGEML